MYIYIYLYTSIYLFIYLSIMLDKSWEKTVGFNRITFGWGVGGPERWGKVNPWIIIMGFHGISWDIPSGKRFHKLRIGMFFCRDDDGIMTGEYYDL